MVKRCRPPALHDFLVESIKAPHVYSRIMIVVNKLMQPAGSHGMNVNKEGGTTEGESFKTKKQLEIYGNNGDFRWGKIGYFQTDGPQ